MRGVVGPWVTVALLALLGMAALVIDIGRVIVAAQHMQQVVDAAALAGAVKLPEQGEAEAGLQQIVSANNTETPPWQVSVTPADDVAYYGPGDTIEGYGALEDDEDAIEVIGHGTVAFTFARIFGLESAEVTRRAVAKASGDRASGDGIFFARETSPSKTGITINGSNQYVDGTIHSNTKVTINGSHQAIMGDVEYRYSYIQNGSDFHLEGDWVETSIMDYPVDYTWAQYDQGPWDHDVSELRINGSNETVAPGRWRVRGDMRINGSNFSCHDCLFVVDGDVIFNGSGHALDRTTIVAKGEITFNGSTERFSCYEDGNNLFAFSLKSSSSTVITVNGSDSDTWGVLYAPNGDMVYNGSSQEIHHGALLAKRITVNGSDGTFCGMGEGGAGGPPDVELIV